MEIAVAFRLDERAKKNLVTEVSRLFFDFLCRNALEGAAGEQLRSCCCERQHRSPAHQTFKLLVFITPCKRHLSGDWCEIALHLTRCLQWL